MRCQSLDWPLSREEKKGCAMQFYEQEVRVQNQLLQTQDATLLELRKELADIHTSRRNSIASTAPSLPDMGEDEDIGADAMQPVYSAPSTAGEPVLRNRRHTLPSRPPAAEEEAEATGSKTVEHCRAKGAPGSRQECCLLEEDEEAFLVEAEAAQEEALQQPCASQCSAASEDACDSLSSTAPATKEKSSASNSGGAFAVKLADVGALKACQADEVRLYAELVSFFRMVKLGSSLEAESWATELVEKYAAGKVPELWAKIASSKKFKLSGFEATMWLARCLGPLSHYQWPKGRAETAPLAVKTLLSRILEDSDFHSIPAARKDALRDELAAPKPNVEVLRCLSFYGCPDEELRPALWKGLLGLLREDQDFRDQLSHFRESKANQALSGEEGGPSDQLRKEVERDAAAAWKGEDFARAPDVYKSVVSVSLATATARDSDGKHVPGVCDMAAMLLWVLADGKTEAALLAEVEADAYLCLQRMLQLGAKPTSDAAQANSVGSLLLAYDHELGQAIRHSGLAPFPAMRLSAALFTKANFKLADCALLWDTILADPVPFEVVEHITVAMLLLSRRELLKKRRDVAAMAEVMLAASQNQRTQHILKLARAVCAFERHCGPESECHFPQRVTSQAPRTSRARSKDGRSKEKGAAGAEGEDTLEDFMQEPNWSAGLQSIWGKVRKGGVDVWKTSRQALRNRLAEQQEQQQPRPSSMQNAAERSKSAAPKMAVAA